MRGSVGLRILTARSDVAEETGKGHLEVQLLRTGAQLMGGQSDSKQAENADTPLGKSLGPAGPAAHGFE